MRFTILILIILRTRCSSEPASDFNMVKVEVPSHVEIGGTAKLWCHKNLSLNQLHSIKWYKDEEEFCRVFPKGRPLVFSTSGINLKDDDCTGISITLTNLTECSTGFYKCEISTEGPQFRFYNDGKNLSVIDPPSEDPKISGILPIYKQGQIASAICTSSPSRPAASIVWFINGKQAKDWQVLEYPMRTVGERYYSTKELRFLVEGPITLQCQAKLPSLPPWQAAVSLPLQLSSYAASLRVIGPITFCVIFIILGIAWLYN